MKRLLRPLVAFLLSRFDMVIFATRGEQQISTPTVAGSEGQYRLPPDSGGFNESPRLRGVRRVYDRADGANRRAEGTLRCSFVHSLVFPPTGGLRLSATVIRDMSNG